MSPLAHNILWAVLLYAGLTVFQVLVRRLRVIAEVRFSLNLLFALFAVRTYLLADLARIHPQVGTGVEAAFLVLGAYIGMRLLDVAVFEIAARRRGAKIVPVVVRDIVRWLLLAVIAFFTLHALFPNLNLNVLAVSSIVVGYIVGNATQDTLGNLVAGLALNTENPFSIGDWVKIGEHIGQVADMNWRATCLVTKNGDLITLPNSLLAKEAIVNYSRPTQLHRVKWTIGTSYDAPPNQVREVISGVIATVKEIEKDPAPRVLLTNFGDFAIEYSVYFYITDYQHMDSIQASLTNDIWYAFKREGISIPFPIRDLRITQPIQMAQPQAKDAHLGEYVDLLKDIGVFAPLSDEERLILARDLREQIYGANEVLFRQGDAGGTFCIVRSGEVRVIARQGDREAEVARLGKGSFFGEMSLFTGEPRNATIVAAGDAHVLVLSHSALGKVLRSNTALAEDFARELEKRQRGRTQSLDSAARPSDADGAGSRSLLVARIRKFFGL